MGTSVHTWNLSHGSGYFDTDNSSENPFTTTAIDDTSILTLEYIKSTQSIFRVSGLYLWNTQLTVLCL